MLGFYNYTVILTYLSLSSSFFGIFMAFSGKPFLAVLCLMISGMLDAFDGKVARTRKRTDAERRFGIQIDSLSDLICFGVLPAAIGLSVGMNHAAYIPVLIIFVLAALIRLAYFNVREEERQSETDDVRKYYEGLPVTATALLIPLVFFFRSLAGSFFVPLYTLTLLLIAIAFVTKFKVCKPGLKGILFLISLGVLELIILLVICFWK